VNHADLEFELPWYLSATLPAPQRERIEASFATCDRCTSGLAELRALSAMLVEIEAAASAPSSALFDDVMHRIGVPSGPARKPWFDPAFLRSNAAKRWGAIAAATAAALIFVQPIAHDLQRAAEPNVALVGHADRAAAPQAPIEKRPMFGAMQAGTAAGVSPTAATESKTADAVSATQRALARTGTIGLIVPDVPSALARIQRLTKSGFGAVTGLDDHAPSSAGGAHTAEVTLSVPDDTFGATLETLAGLGGVTSRSVTAEDLTDSIVDSDARLRNLRHEEADLLRIMDRSGKIADVLDVEQQLASTREAIEQLDAQAKSMRRRVAYATITVDLSDEKTTPVAVVGPGTQIADAWHAALRTLWTFTLWILSKGLLLVAFAPYLAVLGLAAYLIRRRFLRRG
jgi:hypothetical protein